jgi:hypothetical protein
MIDLDAMLLTEDEQQTAADRCKNPACKTSDAERENPFEVCGVQLEVQRDKVLKAVQAWLQELHEGAKAGGVWDAGTLWYLSREIRGSLIRSSQPQEASDV